MAPKQTGFVETTYLVQNTTSSSDTGNGPGKFIKLVKPSQVFNGPGKFIKLVKPSQVFNSPGKFIKLVKPSQVFKSHLLLVLS